MVHVCLTVRFKLLQAGLGFMGSPVRNQDGNGRREVKGRDKETSTSRKVAVEVEVESTRTGRGLKTRTS